MPLIVTNSVLVRLIWASGGMPYAINVVGASGVAASAVNQDLANSLDASIKAAFNSSALATEVSATIGLQQVGVRSIAAPNQAEFLGVGAAVPGTAGGFPLPPQVAFVITMRTALAGKEYRGRIYLPGFAGGALAPGGAASAAVGTKSVAFVNALKDALTGSGLTLAIVSRKLQLASTVTAIISRDNVFDTQRRRAVPGI